MKRCLPLGSALAAGLLLCAGASAAGPTVTARAYVVQNAATGEVLAAKSLRLRLRVAIASITKLMAVLVALDHARPGDPIVVSRAAANVAGSQAGLYEGQVFTVREQVGELRVYDGGTLVASAPLFAARSVGRPALGGRLCFYAGRTAHRVWSWLS